MTDVPPPIPTTPPPPPAPLTPQPAAPTQSFRLRWYTLTLGAVVISLFLIAALITPVPVEGANSYGIGYAMRSIIGALACPTIAALAVGGLAYLIAGRSTRALNIAASATLAILLLLGVIFFIINLVRAASA